MLWSATNETKARNWWILPVSTKFPETCLVSVSSCDNPVDLTHRKFFHEF